MLTIMECETDIQVLPVGEETFHSWDNNCSCFPKVSLGETGKMIVVHNAYDKRELLDIAYETPLHRVRQEIDC
jgi:hypothetical protein